MLHSESYHKFIINFIHKRKGILFLDIDGCLNHQNFYERRTSNYKHLKSVIDIYVKKEFSDYDDSEKNSFKHNATEIDYESLSLINDFCIKNELDVVISSTWRNSFNVNQFIDLFRFCLGLKRILNKEFDYENTPIPDVDFMNIIGVTPYTKERIRGVEIQCYLKNNINSITDGCQYYEYKKYLIVDDDSDMLLEQKPNFFKCSPFVGITQQYIEKLQKFVDSKKFKNENNKYKNCMVTLIACVDKNMGIGFNGDLLIQLKEDMLNFKNLTNGKTVVMGFGTYKSMRYKLLPNRKNVIVTKNSYDELIKKLENQPTAFVVKDLESFLVNNTEEIFIIGGEEIYNQSIFYADRLIITHVNKVFGHVDKFFPEINPTDWKVSETIEKRETKYITDNPIDGVEKIKYSIRTYIRK